MNKYNISVLPGFYILIAAAVLLIPFRWLVAWLTAALLHEMAHIVCLRLMGYDVLSVKLGMTGANIETDGQSGLKLSVCALAGPLCGFLLLMLLRIAPRVAVCGGIQSLYNLIPLYPLDGGRVIRGLIEHIFPAEYACRIIAFWENFILLSISIMAFFASIKLHLGIYPLLFAALLICRNKKIPCKHSLLRVQ